MKKSELKQLIRECYKEVIIENSNPFFDGKIEEESNPFFDSKIEDSKIEKESNPSHETLSEYSDINVEDEDIKDAYDKMFNDVKKIGKKSDNQRSYEYLREIPLFRQILDKGYFKTSVRPGDLTTFFSPYASTTVKYEDYLENWNAAVEKYEKRHKNPLTGIKGSLPDEFRLTKRKAEKLLNILKANNGKPLETFELLTLTSRNGEDMIKINCKVSSLAKILTLGIAKSEFTYLYVAEAKGTFAGLEGNIADDKDELNKLGNAILASVEKQGGTVTMGGRRVGEFDKFTSIYGRT